MKLRTFQVIMLILFVGFSTTSCTSNRVAQLETQVAELTAQNETLTAEKAELIDEAAALQAQIDEFEQNNNRVFIIDKDGLSDVYFFWGVPTVPSEEKILLNSSGSGFRTFNTKFEIQDARPSIYGLDSTKEVFIEVFFGETAFIEESSVQDDGHTYIQYHTCYTNNLKSCTSYVTITNIKVK